MKEKRYMPTIEAKTKEEFEARYNRVLALPEVITDQIERVSMNIAGLCLEVRYNFKTDFRLVLPNTTTQITPFDNDEIVIYAGDLFFKIPMKKFKDVKITYLFIDMDEHKKAEGV